MCEGERAGEKGERNDVLLLLPSSPWMAGHGLHVRHWVSVLPGEALTFVLEFMSGDWQFIDCS